MPKRILTRLAAAALCLAALSACGPAASSPPSARPESESGAPGPATGAASESAPESAAEETPEQKRAQALLAGMTDEEKVGQLFLARCPDADAAQKAAQYRLGGYLLFARDFSGKTRDQVVETIQSYQAASSVPMLIAVDEEGGEVNRVSLNPALRASPFLSPRALYAQGGWALVESDAAEKCALLSSLGVNLNLAPVCDVSGDPADYIYPRSFGGDASQVSEYVRRVVAVSARCGMGCALKHFPGYGNNIDTHGSIARDDRSLAQFEECDLLPFSAGIAAGADCVLVSHNIVSCIDPDRPASLSPAVHALLRDELGFDGAILTDDLVMKGVQDFAGVGEAAVMAVNAGNDLLCSTDFEEQIPAVLDAVRSGRISAETLDRAVMRVLLLKAKLGLI